MPPDPVSTEKLKRWERDNLCGICPYRQSIQAENERLREALTRLEAVKTHNARTANGDQIDCAAVARSALHPTEENDG